MLSGGAVLGYGTPEGARMREFTVGRTTAPDAEPAYITDPDTGEPAVSVPDTDELQSVASGLGVPYFQRTGGDDDAPTKDFTDVDVTEVFSEGREHFNRRTYLTWPLGAVASLLLVWELMALIGADRAAARLTRSGPGGAVPGPAIPASRPGGTVPASGAPMGGAR